MDISHKQLERVDVLKVAGRVDHQTAPDLEKALREVINQGRHNIVVDLSDVSYISSAGLKALQSTAKSARSGLIGGDLDDWARWVLHSSDVDYVPEPAPCPNGEPPREPGRA